MHPWVIQYLGAPHRYNHSGFDDRVLFSQINIPLQHTSLSNRLIHHFYVIYSASAILFRLFLETRTKDLKIDYRIQPVEHLKLLRT
jgi:hypothetical protein